MTTKPTRRKAPVNRRASKAEREAAAELVRRYLDRDPYRVEIEGRIVEHFVDGDALACALQNFAEDGTFLVAEGLPRAERVLIIKDWYSRLRDRGVGQEDAIGLIAECRGISEQTVRDALYGRKHYSKAR